MNGAIIDDPKHAGRRPIGLLAHHLFDQAIKGFDAVIEIASLGIDLPLAEIYAGVECR